MELVKQLPNCFNAVCVQANASVNNFVCQFILVKQPRQIFKKVIAANIALPSGMNRHKRKQPTTKIIGVIFCFYSLPVLSITVYLILVK
jgi:hypothetical protein